METYEELMAMSNKARAAGNTVDARRLTDMAGRAADAPAKTTPATAAPEPIRDAAVGTAFEAIHGAVRPIAAGVDFLASPLQSLMTYIGSDIKIPQLSPAIPAVGTQGAPDGLVTEMAVDAGELGMAALPAGALLRQATKGVQYIRTGSKGIEQAARLGETTFGKILHQMGSTTAGTDIVAGASSGAFGTVVGEGAAEVFGEEWRGSGEFTGQILAPAAWFGTVEAITRVATSKVVTTAQLKGSSQALYKMLDDANIQAKPNSIASMTTKIDDFVTEHGLTAAGNTGAMATRMLRIQKELKAGRMTYSMLDEISRAFKKDMAGADDFLSNKSRQAAEMIDNMIYDMVPTDGLVGGKSIKQVLDSAKDYWRRGSISETIDKIAQDVSETIIEGGGNFDQMFRKRLTDMARPNGNKEGQFMTLRDRAELLKATQGKGLEQFLRGTSRFMGIGSNDYTRLMGISVLTAALGAVKSGGAAAIGAGVYGGAALLTGAAIGKAAQVWANTTFRTNANYMRAYLAAGTDARQLVRAYNRYTPPSERNARDLALMLIKGEADVASLAAGKVPRDLVVGDAVFLASVGREALEAADQERRFPTPPD